MSRRDPPEMRFETHTEPGGKPRNEDYLLARAHPSIPALSLFFLADGQGGQSNGALAAQTACDTAYRLMAAESRDRLFRASTLTSLLEETDREVEQTGGFTTLLALVLDLSAFQITGASVGDSRIYANPGSGEIDELTGNQRKNPPVGSGSAIFESFERCFSSGSRILMVSDGVWKYAGLPVIQSGFALPEFASVSGHLKSAVLRGCSALPDDFSIISISIP